MTRSVTIVVNPQQALGNLDIRRPWSPLRMNSNRRVLPVIVGESALRDGLRAPEKDSDLHGVVIVTSATNA
jgi:hypothetical protein